MMRERTREKTQEKMQERTRESTQESTPEATHIRTAPSKRRHKKGATTNPPQHRRHNKKAQPKRRGNSFTSVKLHQKTHNFFSFGATTPRPGAGLIQAKLNIKTSGAIIQKKQISGTRCSCRCIGTLNTFDPNLVTSNAPDQNIFNAVAPIDMTNSWPCLPCPPLPALHARAKIQECCRR